MSTSAAKPEAAESAAAAERAIDYERDLAKTEEARIAGLENQATAILGLIVAVAAFSVSAIDGTTLEDHKLAIGAAAAALFLAAGFAIAARGPRASSLRFWAGVDAGYAALEGRLERAEGEIRSAATEVDGTTILEGWRARRAVFSYLAERKAMWLTCALCCLLVSFVAAAVAILVIAA